MSYDIKSIKQDFKDKGIFYTTPELAIYLKGFLPEDVHEIYDPTCGDGGLLSVFDDAVEKYGQDINKDQVEVAQNRLKNFHGIYGDTLTNPAFMDRKFKYIIGNPPFSIKWIPIEDDERFNCLPVMPPNSKADYAFLAHILYMLTEDGTAVVLNFPGILYRGQREGKLRRWFIENNYIDTVIAVDGDYFVDTKIATCVLIIKKNKDNTNIKFIHNDKEHIATFEEVKNQDFNLSVNLYIDETPPKEEVNPLELETLARANFLKKLDAELSFEKQVCDMEGISIKPFLESIQNILKKYY